jgi:hypothetical protein
MSLIVRREFIQGLLSFAHFIAAKLAATATEIGEVANQIANVATRDIGDPIVSQPQAEGKGSRTLKTRKWCAPRQNRRMTLVHPNNGNDRLVFGWCSNFSKGLPQTQVGTVDTGCYESLLNALQVGTSEAFQQIPRRIRGQRAISGCIEFYRLE